MEVNVNRRLSSLACQETHICDMNKADNMKAVWARWGRAVLEDLAKSRAAEYRFLHACLPACLS
jgi:hypothetical protein